METVWHIQEDERLCTTRGGYYDNEKAKWNEEKDHGGGRCIAIESLTLIVLYSGECAKVDVSSLGLTKVKGFLFFP